MTPSHGRCPLCKQQWIDTVGMNGDRDPKPGDFALCFHCGATMVFRKRGRRVVRTLITQEDYDSTDADGRRDLDRAARIIQRRHGTASFQ